MLCVSLGSREFEKRDKSKTFIVTTLLFRGRYGRWCIRDIFDMNVSPLCVVNANFTPDGDIVDYEIVDNELDEVIT